MPSPSVSPLRRLLLPSPQRTVCFLDVCAFLSFLFHSFCPYPGFEADVEDDEHKLKMNPRTYGSKFNYVAPTTRADEADL